MTQQDENLFFYAFVFYLTEQGMHGVIQDCRLKCIYCTKLTPYPDTG